ncbi:hypothetical protein E2C01_088565 [Portunus trituberculatus]|uniref:Uncharacterized protein n=1 Tax=Portunus trituberculatus TaxID=210409 RepID=A0A5B7JF02_PORTR|nr:hypothetical protein [Portunus trituberculatus]
MLLTGACATSILSTGTRQQCSQDNPIPSSAEKKQETS